MVGALGRARTAIPPCVPVCKSHSTLYRTAEPPCVPVCKSHSTLYRTAIIAALNGRPVLFSREERVEGSAWLARLCAPARQNRRASPECEYHSTLYRTAIFAVLNGRPLQSVHALLSALSSLFSTFIPSMRRRSVDMPRMPVRLRSCRGSRRG